MSADETLRIRSRLSHSVLSNLRTFRKNKKLSIRGWVPFSLSPPRTRNSRPLPARAPSLCPRQHFAYPRATTPTRSATCATELPQISPLPTGEHGSDIVLLTPAGATRRGHGGRGWIGIKTRACRQGSNYPDLQQPHLQQKPVLRLAWGEGGLLRFPQNSR